MILYGVAQKALRNVSTRLGLCKYAKPEIYIICTSKMCIECARARETRARAQREADTRA